MHHVVRLRRRWTVAEIEFNNHPTSLPRQIFLPSYTTLHPPMLPRVTVSSWPFLSLEDDNLKFHCSRFSTTYQLMYVWVVILRYNQVCTEEVLCRRPWESKILFRFRPLSFSRSLRHAPQFVLSQAVFWGILSYENTV